MGDNGENTNLNANQTENYFEEQLRLHGSDNPGTMLITTYKDESNYLIWKACMITALEAKTKLGFIDRGCPEPELNTTNHRRWKKVNSMVVSWIKNSISKTLVRDFMYVQDARILWNQIAEQYGTANAALLFQIKRNIALMQQNELSVPQYYSGLKQLWDQLDQLRPPLQCTGQIKQQLEERECEDKTMQFLMGLSETFDSIKDQVLLMDPLPNVSKVFSMIHRAESQRRSKITMGITSENSAMAVRVNSKSNDHNNHGGRRNFQRRDKTGLKCSHCNRAGHMREECFLLNGFPDCYQNLKNQKPKPQINAVADTSHEGIGLEDIISDLVKKEILKNTKENDIGESEKSVMMNFAGHNEFVGNSSTLVNHDFLKSDSWIIDSGATGHATASIRLLSKIVKAGNNLRVFFPDGRHKSVHSVGIVTLSNNITLMSVFLFRISSIICCQHNV